MIRDWLVTESQWTSAVIAPWIPVLVQKVVSLEVIGWELDMRFRQAFLTKARLKCEANWPEALRGLQGGRALEDVLSMTFPQGTPASVALEMLRTADPFEDSNNPETIIEMQRVIEQQRDRDCKRIGKPPYLYVARIEGNKLAEILVESRKKLRIQDARLVTAQEAHR